jgi:hypothetical protein
MTGDPPSSWGRSSLGSPTVLYQVRETGRGSFELELDKPPEEGKPLPDESPTRKRAGVSYMVLKVLPGEGGFGGIIEVERITGPGQWVR